MLFLLPPPQFVTAGPSRRPYIMTRAKMILSENHREGGSLAGAGEQLTHGRKQGNPMTQAIYIVAAVT